MVRPLCDELGRVESYLVARICEVSGYGNQGYPTKRIQELLAFYGYPQR